MKEITDDVKLQEHMKIYRQIIGRHLITKKILELKKKKKKKIRLLTISNTV